MGRGGVAADGRAARSAAGRARARARHVDGGRAARREGRAGISSLRCRCIWSRRARSCAACSRQTLAAATRPIAWHRADRGRAGRAVDRHRERIRRRAAGRSVREGSRRLAHAHGRHRRTIGSPSSSSPDALPGHDARSKRRSARSSSGATTSRSPCWRSRIARHGGAALIIDYGHAATGFGDTLQAVRGHTLPIRSPIPGEADLTTQVDFAALAAHRTARGRAGAGPGHAGRFPAPPRHRAARRAAEAERHAAAGRRHRLRRWRGSPRRTRWASCSRCWRSPIAKLGALPGFDS